MQIMPRILNRYYFYTLTSVFTLNTCIY